MDKRSAKLLLVALVVAWIGVLLMPGDSPAQLYRYVDKKGNVVLTDNPPPGVTAEAVEKKEPVSPPSSAASAPKEKPAEAPGTQPPPPPNVAEKTDREVEKAAKEVADKETSRLMAEEEARKQAERQRRLEEADRLEKEAMKPVQPTQDNINRQMKLMQDAQRLREMP